MSQVLPFPVIESEPADADMLAIALDLVKAVRQGTITSFALVTCHPDDDTVRSRWVTTSDGVLEIINCVLALHHDLLASRDGNN